MPLSDRLLLLILIGVTIGAVFALIVDKKAHLKRNLSPFWIVGIGIFVAFFVRFELDRQKRFADGVRCKENLKRLSLALLYYANDWDDHLPPANRWADCINTDKYLRATNRYEDDSDTQTVFHCPALRGGSGYAMNKAVSGLSLSSSGVSNTILLFETDLPGRNIQGGARDVAVDRHGTVNASFGDGSAGTMNLYLVNHRIWEPNPEPLHKIHRRNSD